MSQDFAAFCLTSATEQFGLETELEGLKTAGGEERPHPSAVLSLIQLQVLFPGICVQRVEATQESRNVRETRLRLDSEALEISEENLSEFPQPKKPDTLSLRKKKTSTS